MADDVLIGARARILVVDDDPALLETTSALLSLLYDVETASSGEEALVIAERGLFDVVCTDYRMPGINGAELLERIRARQPGTWGVIVTGYREFRQTRPEKLDSFTLVFKPYAPDILLEAVANAIRSARVLKDTAALTASHSRGRS